MIKLVRQLDAVRRDLVDGAETQRRAQKMQNERLRKAVVALRQQRRRGQSVGCQLNNANIEQNPNRSTDRHKSTSELVRFSVPGNQIVLKL